jgi:hypothetical protein
MDNLLWSMTQQSRSLLDLRKNIQGIWQDEAARELTSRYLDPHENEDQRMLARLNQQKDTLEQASAKLTSAEKYGQQAEELGLQVDEGLKSTEQELQSAYGNYDTYIYYNSEASSKLPTIQNLINQANSACDT